MENDILTCVAVDDDPLMLTILNAYIRRTKGIELVGEYNNYYDAATNITKLTPDIIFLDINMPGLSGLEMLEVLDNKPLVIIVSADLRSKEVLMAKPEIVDFLEKPIFYKTFRQVIFKTISALSGNPLADEIELKRNVE